MIAPFWLARRAGENSALCFCENCARCWSDIWAFLSAQTSQPVRLRAAAILTAELAYNPYMPSLLSPPELPLTLYFGGQATVVNADTFKALERKVVAKKSTRPAVPQNSALLQKTVDGGTHYSGPFLS